MGLEGCNLTLDNVQLNVKAQIGIRVENAVQHSRLIL